MQEENTSSGDTQQQSVNDISHQYYEVGREILSKPNLLCDIVESLESYPVLIYCNTPSDTDFAEVMLKKRGISSQKLIGNVPQEKIDATFDLINKKQLSAIVLTDIAARLIDLSPFSLAINYSSPQDADTYLDRCGLNKTKALKKMLTLVSPLELANFHFIKKGLSINPEVAPAPSQENILKARFQTLKSQALAEEQAGTESILSVAKLILSDPDKDRIIALLLHNSLTVLPALRTASQKAADVNDEENFDIRSDRDRGGDREGRNERGDRGDRWNNRGDRGDRGGDRGGRSRQDNYRSRDRYEDNNDNGGGRNDSYDDDDSQGDNQRGQDRRPRQNGRQFDRQIKKDARIYLGQGSEEGVTKEQVLELLNKHGISADGLKHLSIRKNYSFFDIDDEKSGEIIENLKSEDEKKTAVKAITINAVMPEEPENERSDEDSRPESEGAENDSYIPAEEESDNIGNR